MSEFCSLCRAVEHTPYCAQHGVVHRAFAIGGHYELAQLIGVSGASFVFGGKDLRAGHAGRSVAVKVLRASTVLDGDARRREVDELALRAYDRLTDIIEIGWDSALGVSYLVIESPPAQATDTTVQHLLALDTVPPPEPAEVFEVPAMIGSYRVVEALGTGGHGRVYLGEHPVIGSKVAIKMLRPDIARSAETVERFIQEARASSQIASSHIPRYFDFGTTSSGVPYAIMEYFDGETLGSRLARGTMSIAETAQVVEQVASALAMAHDAGLIHRDLKPDNLFLVKPDSRRSAPMVASSAAFARQGEPVIDVKVLDFGIAKMIGTLSATRTESGSFLGTPYYCAPEQVFGRPVDARTDVYSLGATAYEMLTGTPPFVGEVHEIMSAKAIQEPPELRIPGVPAVVAYTIRRMLARDPDDRAPSMSWVLAQVARWGAPDEGGRASTSTTWNETDRTLSHTIPDVGPANEPTMSHLISRRRVALVTVAVLAVASMAVGLAWRSRGTGRTAPAPEALTVEPPAGAPARPVVASPSAPPSGPPVSPSLPAGPPASPPDRASAGSASASVVDATPPPTETARPPVKSRATKPASRPRPEKKRPAVPAPPRDSKDVLIVDPFGPAH